ncbi:MAG TPA: matrixin family metalloprotease [Blastocatellia bacterium]|nr:matrixin family metalloprotease [Blastocatellia bacterium]
MKPRTILLSLLGCLLVIASSDRALGTTAIIPRDDEMVVESRAIVMGKVVALSTAVDSNTELVYTYVRVSLNTVLRGQITESEIVLKELGGETRDHGTLIYGSPRFVAGEEVFLYLNTWPDGSLRVHQGFIGKFDITRDAATGRAFVERRLEDQNVIITVDSAQGTNRSELDAYTESIVSLVAANQKRIRRFDEQYYQGVPIFAQPPEFEPANGFTPMWVLLNPSSPARWFEADSNQPITFYVNPAGAPSFVVLQEDMQAAMDAWSKAGGSIRVNYGGTTGGCGVQGADGQNTISFNNCDGYFSASQGCSGLLAVSGIIRYIPNQTKNIGGTTYGKAVEANMSFNPYALCNFTNRCQIQEVATHEMGHALGLGHATDTTATMSPYAHFDGRCASVMSDDTQGIDTVYPGSSQGPLSITTNDLPSGTQGIDYSANLAASGGAGGYHWRLTGGQLPIGIQLGMSGLLYGKTSAAGSFAFTTQVADSSGNALQRSFTLVVSQVGASPLVTSAEYRKKKVFVTGQNFQADAVVYVDGDGVAATLGAGTLTTLKKKQKAGVHNVYVVNPDGRQSNTFQYVVE